MPDLFKDEKVSPFLRNNLAVAYANLLTHRRVFEQALEVLKTTKAEQVADPGAYLFARAVCEHAYAAYQRMLEAGNAREVARIVLPVTIYSSMYVTMNARSLMNFLSLRTKREDSHFPSFPQREIEMAAEQMEAEWARLMPLTHAAFEKNGRVAP